MLPLITKVQTNSWPVFVGALLVHLPLWLKIPSPSEMTLRKFKGQPLGCLYVGICSSSQKREAYRVAEVGSLAISAPREVEGPHIVREQLHPPT